MATISFGELLESTQEAEGEHTVYVDMGGRYVDVSHVKVDGDQVVIVLDLEDI